LPASGFLRPLVLGQSPEAVAVLMVMHLAIAVVTYNVLVGVAAVRPQPARARQAAPRQSATID
jgi:hypothetical protein